MAEPNVLTVALAVKDFIIVTVLYHETPVKAIRLIVLLVNEVAQMAVSQKEISDDDET